MKAPNFFDVIAMGVLAELLRTPQGVEELVITSIEVAEEVATLMDQSSLADPFGERQRAFVMNQLASSFDKGAFQNGIELDYEKFLRVSQSLVDLFKRVQLAIEPNATVNQACPIADLTNMGRKA